MSDLETFLRVNGETVTYVVFFGLLILLGLAEMLIERSPDPANRRQRWPANFALTGLNIVVLGALPVSGLIVADRAADAGFGVLNVWTIPLWAAIPAGILARSLVSWATHLAMHKVPLLWRVHRVHHSDTRLDVATTVRFHPVELLINLPLVVVAIAGLGIPPAAIMIYEILDAGMNVFTHANIRLPSWLNRTMRPILVTPDMHRVHHSSFHRETDSNYGATLSIWDHLFGTFREKDAQALADTQMGLREIRDRRADRLIWLLSLPFRPARLPGSVRPVSPHPGDQPKE